MGCIISTTQQVVRLGKRLTLHTVSFSRERNEGQPTPVFCLGNPTEKGAWQATVHGM